MFKGSSYQWIVLKDRVKYNNNLSLEGLDKGVVQRSGNPTKIQVRNYIVQ
jgi:hypothetical protein